MMRAADCEPPEPIDAVDEALRRAAEEHACAADDADPHARGDSFDADLYWREPCADDDGEHDVCPVAVSL